VADENSKVANAPSDPSQHLRFQALILIAGMGSVGWGDAIQELNRHDFTLP
jgi:hypothetical protein